MVKTGFFLIPCIVGMYIVKQKLLTMFQVREQFSFIFCRNLQIKRDRANFGLLMD